MMRKFNKNDYKNVNGGMGIYQNGVDTKHKLLVLEGNDDVENLIPIFWKVGADNKDYMLKRADFLNQIKNTISSTGMKPLIKIKIHEDLDRDLISAINSSKRLSLKSYDTPYTCNNPDKYTEIIL